MRTYDVAVEGRTLRSGEELIKLRFRLESDEFKIAAGAAMLARARAVPAPPPPVGAQFTVHDRFPDEGPRVVIGSYKPEVVHERYNFVESAIRAYKRASRGWSRCIAIRETPPRPGRASTGEGSSRWLYQAGAQLGFQVECKELDSTPKDWPLVRKERGVEYMVGQPHPLEACTVEVYANHTMDEVDAVEVQLLLVLERRAVFRELDDTENAWRQYREIARAS